MKEVVVAPPVTMRIVTVEPRDQVSVARKEGRKGKLVSISRMRMCSGTERVLSSAPWFQDVLYIKRQLEVGVIDAINWLKLDISSQEE